MVTIIITYIDEDGFLREALDSALDQTLPDKEIIVVCNDLDNHNAVFESEYAQHKIMWLHTPVKGSARARNLGLSRAKGEWIQFLDVDDLLLPGKIEGQNKVARGGAVVSPHLFKRTNGKTETSKWLPKDIWEGLLNSGLGSTSSMLWNTSALKSAGGWSSDFNSHQEYELLFRLLKTGYEVTPLRNMDTIVRERKKGSITLMTKGIRELEGIRLREEMWDFLQRHAMQSPARKNAFRQYVFRQLRGLYRFDTSKAKAIYGKYFASEKFHPEQVSLPLYSVIYKTLGFNLTEKIFSTYASLRDKYLHFLPTNN